LASADFYAMNSNFNVYKCIFNNLGQPSTVQPFGIDSRPITLSDGYTWKYIYTVNPSARTKFMTKDYIPVANPLDEVYFRRGSIGSVNIKSSGSGYSNNASILVQGDGFQEANPYSVFNVTVENGGSGYTTTPTVTVAAPFASFISYANGVPVILGQYVKNGAGYYEVTRAGTLSSTPPTHFTGTVDYGTGFASLKYAATQALATGIFDTGKLGSVFLTNAGFGYTFAPSVTITGGGGTGATANTTIDDGIVQAV
jgi:hypothetical protein